MTVVLEATDETRRSTPQEENHADTDYMRTVSDRELFEWQQALYARQHPDTMRRRAAWLAVLRLSQS